MSPEDRPDVTSESAAPDVVAVGVDGTSRSVGAIRYAADEAARSGAVLRLVHVSPSYVPLAPLPLTLEDLRTEAHSALEAAAGRALERQPVLVVETQHETGSRVAGLLRGAAGARVLVLGRETRSVMDRMVKGATTAAVASRAPAGTVVVPQDWDGGTVHGRILLGIKRPATSPHLLARAFDLARERGATLVVVHAWQLPDAYSDMIAERVQPDAWHTEGMRALTGLVEHWKAHYPEVEVELEVVHGNPAQVLTEQSARSDVLLVVRHRRDATHLWPLGGVARAMMRLSEAPVEVVPDGPDSDLAPGLRLEEDGQMLR